MTGDMSFSSDTTQQGIIPRAISDILIKAHSMKKSGWSEINITVSIAELYNEDIKDLLSKNTSNSNSTTRIKINKINSRVVVSGLTCTTIDTTDCNRGLDQFKTLLEKSFTNRTTASTGMNESSSRSHLIVMIEIAGRHSDGMTIMQGALRLCDLAGSERLDRTGTLHDTTRYIYQLIHS